MIPGTLCDKRLFSKQTRVLRGVANVRVTDYRHLSAVDAQPYAQQWATRLLEQLPEKFSVLGFSLGGIWALELLRQAPHRIERIAMVASNAQAASTKNQRSSRILARRWNKHCAASSMNAGGAGRVLRHALPHYFHHQRALQRHAPLLHKMAASTPHKAALAQFSWAASRPSGIEELSRFAGPVLIVSGAKDKLCPPTWQRAMQQTRHTSARECTHWLELPRVAHFVPLEASSHLNNAIRQWICAQPAPEHIASN